MLARLTLSALLLFPAAAVAADPPAGASFVAQTQPAARLLADARQFVQTVAGPQAERALKEFDRGLEGALGEKGLEGLDVNRPVAAYGALADDPARSWAVFVFPLTTGKDFLDLVGRVKLSAAEVAGKKGLYTLEPPAGRFPVPAFLRLTEAAAYVSVNDPDGDRLADPAKLPAAESLVRADEMALFTVRAAVDRLPAKWVRYPFEQFTAFRKQMMAPPAGPPGAMRFAWGVGATELFLSPVILFAGGNVDAVLADGTELAVRLNLSPTSEMSFEVGVTAKPGTALAKRIAGLPPTANKLAGLVPKDHAAGGTLTFPTGTPAVRDAVVDLLDMAGKGVENSPPPLRPVLGELVTGATRTVKAGDLDAALALLPADAGGHVHGVAAVAFDDPSALEKAVRELVKALPADAQKRVTLDAGKAGPIALHTVQVGKDSDRELRRLFGDDALLAVGFGPTAVYAAIGSDPLSVLQAAIPAATPGPARPFDARVNPARFVKVIAATAGEEAAKRFADLFGADDASQSVVSVAAEGGGEFKLRLTVSPTWLPRGVGGVGVGGSAPAPAVKR